MNKIQRTFIPGDEWIYFKIYTGIKTADFILTDYIYRIIKKLQKEKLISKWFFIRYADPDFHLRFRILVEDKKDIGYVITLVSSQLRSGYNNSHIRKIELSTYVRELERYGFKTMNTAESIFWIDSECLLSLIKLLNRNEESIRWESALILIDSMLDDAKFSLEEKLNCLNSISISFKAEFGFNMHNSKQLNHIYRSKRTAIESILKNKDNTELHCSIRQVVNKRSNNLYLFFDDIQESGKKISLNNYLHSFIHMSMNRLFRSKNRTYELLIYDFLSRYYKSEVAKQNFI